MVEKQYVLVVKRDQAQTVPLDWRERLTAIDGVSIIGSSPLRVQFMAEPEAAEKVRSELGPFFHFEEIENRNPLG